jgi:hypothetical protein
MLDASLVRKKGYFWRKIMQEGKENWKENKHVEAEKARRACKEDLMMLGLGVL